MKQLIVKCVCWAAAAACVCLILFMSSETADESSVRSIGVSERVADLFINGFTNMNPEEKQAVLEKIHSGIRVGGHISEYAMLGVTLAAVTLNYKKIKKYRFPISAAAGLTVSICDELYQITVPGRAFELFDIACDLFGAALGAGMTLVVCGIIVKSVKKRQKN